MSSSFSASGAEQRHFEKRQEDYCWKSASLSCSSTYVRDSDFHVKLHALQGVINGQIWNTGLWWRENGRELPPESALSYQFTSWSITLLSALVFRLPTLPLPFITLLLMASFITTAGAKTIHSTFPAQQQTATKLTIIMVKHRDTKTKIFPSER